MSDGMTPEERTFRAVNGLPQENRVAWPKTKTPREAQTLTDDEYDELRERRAAEKARREADVERLRAGITDVPLETRLQDLDRQRRKVGRREVETPEAPPDLTAEEAEALVARAAARG